jgi:hypothetical protein
MKVPFFKKIIHSTFVVAIAISFLILGVTSCNPEAKENSKELLVQSELTPSITEQEILDAQKAWGEGIVLIGKTFLEEGDYKAVALKHINKFYNYSEGSVLFKPTLASHKQFRTNIDGALSYFVAGDDNYTEDHGFAIKPWSSVRWESIGTKIIGNMAVAMGNYYFTPSNGGDEVKVEYSFAYTKNKDGELKIILHGSHLPYAPEEKH